MRKLLNTLYVTSENSYLALDGENLVVYDEKKELGRLPLHNLDGIVSFGYRGTSPALMGACAERNISLCYLTPQGKFLARVTGKVQGNVLLREQQYKSKNYISTELKYEVYDFVYDSSEYEKLQNHKYQMMVIKDCPRFIPFMSMKESTNLKKNRIYIRRGTSCEEATSEEITDIIKRRMNAEYPDSGKTLNLDEHLEQLKTLYSKISPTNEYYQGGIGNSLLKLTEVIKAVSAGEWISEDNPLYPEEDYEESQR